MSNMRKVWSETELSQRVHAIRDIQSKYSRRPVTDSALATKLAKSSTSIEQIKKTYKTLP